MCRESIEDVFQIDVGIVAVEQRGSNQAHDRRSALSGAQRTGKQPVRPTDGPRTDLVLGSNGRRTSVQQVRQPLIGRRVETSALSAGRSPPSERAALPGAPNEKPRESENSRGFVTAYWRRRRDSNPRSRFWPRCSLSRGVPSTSRPRLPNFSLHREAVQRDQDNNGNDSAGQIMRHIFLPHRRSALPGRTNAHAAEPFEPQNHRTTHDNFETASRRIRLTPDPARTPCGARAQPAPCTSRRSAPKS